MSENFFDFSLSKDELKLQLSCFSGPLDLLLSMVKEAKIEIKDIFVSNITNQFLEYMSTFERLDIELGSEYMEITATLLEIKSRSMLPEIPIEEIEEETPEQEIIRRLDEFRLLKEASEKLKEKENIDRFYKSPESFGEAMYSVKDFSIEKLLEAYTQVLLRNKVIAEGVEQGEKEIVRDAFTVADKIKYIQNMINKNSTLSFYDLFNSRITKIEVIVTFSALLELMKLQYIIVEQKDEFEDILLTKNLSYSGSEDLNYDSIDVG